MSRRIPNCAYCGRPLKDMDHVLRHLPALAGKPEVGWHTEGCFEQDELYLQFHAKHAIALAKQLKTIESRGPGRLVANKDWEQSKGGRFVVVSIRQKKTSECGNETPSRGIQYLVANEYFF